MPRHLDPGGTPPPGMQLVTCEQLAEATACQDCDSVLRLIPVTIPLPIGAATQLFGVYIAHDDTCPAMAAAVNQQKGNPQ